MNSFSGIPNVQPYPRIHGDDCRVPGEEPGGDHQRWRRRDHGPQRRRVTDKHKSESSADLSVRSRVHGLYMTHIKNI